MRGNLPVVALSLFTLTACEQPPSSPSGADVAIIDPLPSQRWIPPTPAEREQRLAEEDERLRQMEESLLAKLRTQQLFLASQRPQPPLDIDAARREASKALADNSTDQQLILEVRAGQILEQQRMDLEQRRRSSAANQALIAPKGFGPDPNDPRR